MITSIFDFMSSPSRRTPLTQRRNDRRNIHPISICLLFLAISPVSCLHHMKRAPLAFVNRQNSDKPLTVMNNCGDTIYPAIQTQAGTAPSSQGFPLAPGEMQNLTVSADWQGRVWGRTNCSFNAAGNGAANTGPNGGGVACTTGDCGGIVDCQGTGQTPATLAEFTLTSSSGQAFYDISLVDGYNIPIGIVALFSESGNSSLMDIPPNLTNPVCIGTASLLAAPGSVPDEITLGTNASFPLPVDQSQSQQDVQQWCPWDLQLNPPQKPGDGVYPYPDDNIQRPLFDPCISACSKTNAPQDCCTGSYDSPQACQPSYYSTQAKSVCPDAYSYAFDDQTSTFIVPSGGGFGVTFCPPGRSSNILATLGPQLRQLSQTGHVDENTKTQLQNASFIEQLESAGTKRYEMSRMAVAVAGVAVWASVMTSLSLL